MNVNEIFALYPCLSFFAYFFGRFRFIIAPIEEIIALLPRSGNVIDIGCGHGFITNAIAIRYPNVKVRGMDINKSRIDVAKSSLAKRTNISFSVLDVIKKSLPKQKFDGIVCFDLLHHLPQETQIKIITQAYNLLKKNGVFIIKDIDTVPVYKYLWNLLHDMLVTDQQVHCRHHQEWIDILKENKFKIEKLIFSKKGWLYPHFIIVSQK